MKIITCSELGGRLASLRQPYHAKYYAMYSSYLDGIVTDPALMLVPVDDHLVHRGDGVFESVKCVDGALYNMPDHLLRLRASAAALNLAPYPSDERLQELTVETVRAGGRPDCAVRLLISRGPGSFTVNPYDCPAPCIYIIATHLSPPFMSAHPEGAVVRRSAVPAKPAYMAGVKNCNYLPNVLMKKEAIDLKVDLTVAFDSNGHMGEGPTENLGIVTADRRLLFPRLDNILRGTTMTRLIDLAGTLTPGLLSAVETADISDADIAHAQEMLIVGTTWNVAAVREFDGKPVGTGTPGPVFKALYSLLDNDIHTNQALRTNIY